MGFPAIAYLSQMQINTCLHIQCIRFLRRFFKSLCNCYATSRQPDRTMHMDRTNSIYTGGKQPEVFFQKVNSFMPSEKTNKTVNISKQSYCLILALHMKEQTLFNHLPSMALLRAAHTGSLCTGSS